MPFLSPTIYKLRLITNQLHGPEFLDNLLSIVHYPIWTGGENAKFCEIGSEMSGVTPQSTASAIAESLRCGILTGTFPAGTHLKQSEIAKRFGASVVPVREAFQRIIAGGLAKHEPNHGVMVTSMNVEDIHEIAEIRVLLEPHVLRLSAPRLDVSDLSEAESILMRATTTSNLVERAQLHWDFHRVLYTRSSRPRVLDQLSVLYTSMHRCLMPTWSRVGLTPDWMSSHMEIVAALRRGEVELGCQLVVDQILAACKRLYETGEFSSRQGK